MFQIILLYVLTAATFPMSKILMQYASPLFVVGVRMALAGAAMLVYEFLFRRKSIPTVTRSDVWRLLLYGALGFYVSFAAEFWALNQMSAAKYSLLFNLSPFVTALLTYLMFSEQLTWQKLLGLIIGFCGFLPELMAPASAQEMSHGSWGFVSLPELLTMVAVVTAVYSWTIVQQLTVEKNYNVILVNGVGMFFGGILALFHAHATDVWPPIAAQNIAIFSWWMLVIIVIGNFIAFNLYGHLLKAYTATFLSFAGFLMPLFTAAFGWWWLGETVDWQFYVSLVLVTFGLYLFYRDEKLHGRSVSP